MSELEKLRELLRPVLFVFSQFTVLDAVDILLVAFVIYGLIRFVRETRAVQLVKGIVFLIVAYVVSGYLQLSVFNSLLDYFFQFAFVALLIVFQPEIRRALEQLGKSNAVKSIANVVTVSGRSREEERVYLSHAIAEVATAMQALQRQRMGALLVFERDMKLKEIAETGVVLDAEISAELVGNVFFNKAPLHDGAVIISGGKLHAAGCILPLTTNDQVSSELGTRHRAGLGMSETSDAVVVIVSEETGQISIALNGVLTRNYTRDTLVTRLESLLLPQDKAQEKKEKEPASARKRGKQHGRTE